MLYSLNQKFTFVSQFCTKFFRKSGFLQAFPKRTFGENYKSLKKCLFEDF